MTMILKALRIDLVDVLGTRGPGGKPAVRRQNFEASDRRAVPRGRCEFGRDRVAGELRGCNQLGR
jgi:hypothetical protein